MPFKSSGRGAYGPQGQKVIKGPLAPVWVTSGALSNGNVGQAYSVQLSATDDSGDAPTYTIDSGSLPSGLSLSSSGLISGTIGGSAGTFTFTVNATDVNGRATTSSSLSITTTSPGLYAFTSATFTTGGKTGPDGPDISQARNGVGNPSWASTYLNMTTNGIQRWTVPASGNYRIRAIGAAGGTSSALNPGRGTSMQGDFSLTQGEIINILVAQTGTVRNSSCNAGGGGGTYVWRDSNNNILVIAGGGGGTGGGANGVDATTDQNGRNDTGASSTPGSGGNGASPGGAGWNTNGGTGLDNSNNGNQRPLEGGRGGNGNTNQVGDGGFGGGAGASGQSCGNGGAGGGGGYSGGSGPSNNTNSGAGNGGGSINNGANQSNSAGVGYDSGSVEITKL